MLYALSAPDDAKLKALVAEMDKLRAEAKKRLLPPDAVPPLDLQQLSFSPGDMSVDDKRVLLVDGDPDLSHAAWTAALKAGFDVRGGHIPARAPAPATPSPALPKGPSTFADEKKGT